MFPYYPIRKESGGLLWPACQLTWFSEFRSQGLRACVSLRRIVLCADGRVVALFSLPACSRRSESTLKNLFTTNLKCQFYSSQNDVIKSMTLLPTNYAWNAVIEYIQVVLTMQLKDQQNKLYLEGKPKKKVLLFSENVQKLCFFGSWIFNFNYLQFSQNCTRILNGGVD